MREISFPAFYLMWAERRRWKVPPVHVRVCDWMEHRGELAVLRAHRGFSKSTILAVYNAWRFYCDRQYRILHQSESDPTAHKTSRDTQDVLRNHPLTRGMFREGGVQEWWVHGAGDYRNASMYARGILSNVTSARADECQNDDVEVPRNIQSPEAREKLRYRLGEQTHILVPGGRQLFIGTPHTHDSIYDEMENAGADCMTIRMFEHEMRIEDAEKQAYDVGFAPEFIFHGIGKTARLLTPGEDYTVHGHSVIFPQSFRGIVDCYAGIAWPERFDAVELTKRRRKTRTINEWDSQYQLHSKPLHEIRLDPDDLRPYDVQPVIEHANGGVRMMLGKTQIVSASAWWDCALGRIGGDDSAFSVLLQNAAGHYFWHVAKGLTGDIFEQCKQTRAFVETLQLPRVEVEVNGPGGFAPAVLKKELAGTGCGVGEQFSSVNKNKRILDALEAPLSGGFLWAHVDVIEMIRDEMRDWKPEVKEQRDNFLDSGAGAISATPQRIGRVIGTVARQERESWRPSSGAHEVEFEL